MIDVQINLASPVLTTSASFMKTLKIKFQNLGKDSEVGRGSGKFHPCCSLQIICDTPQCNYSDFCVTMGHLCKYSNVAAFAKKTNSTSRMCEICESGLCKKLQPKICEKIPFSGGVNRQLPRNLQSKTIKCSTQPSLCGSRGQSRIPLSLNADKYSEDYTIVPCHSTII